MIFVNTVIQTVTEAMSGNEETDIDFFKRCLFRLLCFYSKKTGLWIEQETGWEWGVGRGSDMQERGSRLVTLLRATLSRCYL